MMMWRSGSQAKAVMTSWSLIRFYAVNVLFAQSQSQHIILCFPEIYKRNGLQRSERVPQFTAHEKDMKIIPFDALRCEPHFGRTDAWKQKQWMSTYMLCMKAWVCDTWIYELWALRGIYNIKSSLFRHVAFPTYRHKRVCGCRRTKRSQIK